MAKRKVELFSAGCSLCAETERTVKTLVCEDCDLEVHDMRTPAAQAKAKTYGVTRVPSVVVNGTLAECCAAGPVKASTLRALGVGARA
ncbi:MAG: hypothetical protein NVS1B4_20740 [Gemmatimonadaceae bacterium]